MIFTTLRQHVTTTYSGLAIALVLFVMAACLCFLFGNVPYIVQKKREMIMIRKFIALLPLDIIINVKVFRQFFSQVVFAHHH